MTQEAQYNELINTSGKSAADMTNFLKRIGNDNMQAGLKVMKDYFYDSGFLDGRKTGERQGMKKGSFLTLLAGTIVVGVFQAKNVWDNHKLKKSIKENLSENEEELL